MGFRTVIAAVDGSPASLQALRAARRLLAPDGRLFALSVAEVHLAGHTALAAGNWEARIRADAESDREAAEKELAGDPRATTSVVAGRAAAEIVEAATTEGADLIAMGRHGRSRAAGVAFGSVATRVLRDAPCSVLVIGDDVEVGDGFPSAVTVGVDGSACSEAALALANTLGPEPVECRDSVGALLEAAGDSDLVVVGSRGHGRGPLGSVAERVAHRAGSAVLVVRTQDG